MQTSDIIQQNIAFKSEDLRKLLSSLLLSLHTSLDSATSGTLQVDCHCSAVFTNHLAINESSFSIVKQSSCS